MARSSRLTGDLVQPVSFNLSLLSLILCPFSLRDYQFWGLQVQCQKTASQDCLQVHKVKSLLGVTCHLPIHVTHLPTCLPIHPSIYPSIVHLPTHSTIQPSNHLHTHLSTHSSTHLPILPSTYPPSQPSNHTPIHPLSHLTTHLPTHSAIQPPRYSSTYPFTHSSTPSSTHPSSTCTCTQPSNHAAIRLTIYLPTHSSIQMVQPVRDLFRSLWFHIKRNTWKKVGLWAWRGEKEFKSSFFSTCPLIIKLFLAPNPLNTYVLLSYRSSRTE